MPLQLLWLWSYETKSNGLICLAFTTAKPINCHWHSLSSKPRSPQARGSGLGRSRARSLSQSAAGSCRRGRRCPHLQTRNSFESAGLHGLDGPWRRRKLDPALHQHVWVFMAACAVPSHPTPSLGAEVSYTFPSEVGRDA